MKLPTRMIVERRQDEGKNALRSLVLLVKFLTMSLVSSKTPRMSLFFSTSITTEREDRDSKEEERNEEKKGGTRGHERTVASFFLLPFFVIFLRVFHTHSPRLHIGQSNDLTYLFLIIPYAVSFLLSSFFSLQPFSLSYTHTCTRSQTYIRSVFSLIHSLQLHFLALLELFAAGLTVVVGFALQGGLLGLSVLTLLLLLLLRCRIRRSRDGHLDRPSEIVYARR